MLKSSDAEELRTCNYVGSSRRRNLGGPQSGNLEKQVVCFSIRLWHEIHCNLGIQLQIERPPSTGKQTPVT